jgi:thioredoxin 1
VTTQAMEATEATFDTEVLGSEKPVLVDFWAEWCGPCHMVAPILHQIAEERAGELRLVKVNIDEQPAIAQRYGIMSIPTMVLFKGGEPVAGAVGARPKGALEQALGLSEAA